MLRELFPMTMAEIETRQAKKGLHWSLELLVFLAVFFVASMVESMLLIISLLVYILCNPSLISDFFMQFSTGMNLLTDIPDYVNMILGEILLPSLLATATIIVVVMFFCIQLQNRKLPSLGFRRKNAVLEYIGGLILGGIMFSFAVLLAGKSISVAPTNVSFGMIFVFFLAYMIQGMSEEILMRGYFMLSFARRNSILAAILVNSVFFGLLHLGNLAFSPLAFLNIVLFGVFASVWFLKRGSIWGIAAIHTAWNFVQGCVWGIPVSGMPATSTILTSTLANDSAAKLWNGGKFGLEGGIAVTIVLVVFCALAILMPAKRSELAPTD